MCFVSFVLFTKFQYAGTRKLFETEENIEFKTIKMKPCFTQGLENVWNSLPPRIGIDWI